MQQAAAAAPMQPTAENLTLTERVRALADEAVAGTGLYVVDVEVRGFKGSRVVEVYVDGDDGAGVDAIAEVSRRLGFLFDTEDLVAGRYTLNVSSPDATRPLTLPRQYPKHVGRTLDVRYAADGEELTARGALAGVGDDALTLELPDGSDLDIPFDAVREARVALPW
ncbi:MAG: ribosome maturation factor RimP [Rubricoccaceae bacterium]|nr:ribosome maturation factor RimP [Rubricoccaceae bacterium]